MPTSDCLVSNDRRSVRTRAALRLALAQEVDATGDLTRVTVTAVTERAGVTRRTFYSHYKDIPDLVTQIENEALADLRVHVERIAQCHLGHLAEALQAHEPAPGSECLLRAVAERGDYLRPLLGDGGDPAFAERLKRMAYDAVVGRALDGIDVRAMGSFFDYYLTFAISAEVGGAPALARGRHARERGGHGAPYDRAHVRPPGRPLRQPHRLRHPGLCPGHHAL